MNEPDGSFPPHPPSRRPGSICVSAIVRSTISVSWSTSTRTEAATGAITATVAPPEMAERYRDGVEDLRRIWDDAPVDPGRQPV